MLDTKIDGKRCGFERCHDVECILGVDHFDFSNANLVAAHTACTWCSQFKIEEICELSIPNTYVDYTEDEKC